MKRLTKAEKIKRFSVGRRKMSVKAARARRPKHSGRPVPAKKIDKRTLSKRDRAKPASGQHGPKAEIDPAKLNPHELEVWAACDMKKPLNIGDIATLGGLTKLQVRNSLRRLVRGQYLVQMPGRGMYCALRAYSSRPRANKTKKAA